MKAHLQTAYDLFSAGCDRAANLKAIFDFLRNAAPAALNCDDILRSSLVLAVSSFDLFMHDVFRLEVSHRLSVEKEVLALRIPFNALCLERHLQMAIVDEFIRKDNAFKSFVAPNKVAECLRALIEDPWDRIAKKFGESADLCKSRLKQVVDLRNRIAHEADVNPTLGGVDLWPIYGDDVTESVEFLRKLGFAVAQTMDD